LFVNCQLEKKRVVFLAHAPPYPQYSYGQTVTIIGKAKQVSTFEGFDYPLFLERQGATHSIQNAQVALQSEAPLDLKKFLFSLRSYLERKIETHLPEPESSLLNGILLGSNQNLSEELTQTLRNTGTSHIVAISGANVTIVVGLLVLLLPLYTLKSQRNATIVISLLLITMTGASASVVRGGVVASLGSCVKAAGRRKNLCGIILLPACCMLMWNPLYLKADPSFQLSLAAYSGILLLSPSLEVLLGKIVSTLPSAVSSAFKETAAATLGTLPVSFLVFGSVSWLGLLVNPAVLWLLPVITILGGIFLIIPISLVGNLLWLALHVFLEIILTFSHVFS
jgi:competence protein ComEC